MTIIDDQERTSIMATLDGGLRMAETTHHHVGPLIGRLAALRHHCARLMIIMSGRDPITVPSSDVDVSIEGLMLRGALLVPFERQDGWSGHDEIDLPCMTIEEGRGHCMIGPAERPRDHDALSNVLSMVGEWQSDEDVFVSGLDRYGMTLPGPVGLGIEHEGDEASSGVLVVSGLRLRIDDITWSEKGDDGHGNAFLHLMMREGRYLKVVTGDLGR